MSNHRVGSIPTVGTLFFGVLGIAICESLNPSRVRSVHILLLHIAPLKAGFRMEENGVCTKNDKILSNENDKEKELICIISHKAFTANHLR
jgi:hypothetical protein